MEAALIGCGFIGGLIAAEISSGGIPVKLKIILDRNEDKVKKIQGMFDEPPLAAKRIDDILLSEVDIVIEAASVDAAHSFTEGILKSGKNMLIVSVGAFSTPGFYKTVEEICLRNDVKVYIPSGALGALDAVAAASMGRVEDVALTSIKNPKSLEGAPYVVENQIALEEIKERKTIFSGSAADAIEGFPSNVNVAITLSLAGIGTQKTNVKVVVDPTVEQNIHEVRVTGDFGELMFRTENIVSTENPRTSLLAAFSTVQTLKKLTSPIRIG
jgi:aspartate dehydrogenase